MGAIGDQAPNQSRAERARCPHGDGHLEATFLKGAATETEAAIWAPTTARN
jgi:hypothetical protein